MEKASPFSTLRNVDTSAVKKGDRFIFGCRLAAQRSSPRFPRPNRQVSPCTASHLTRFAHPRASLRLLLRYATYLLSSQEKVTKEKATPASGSDLRPDFPQKKGDRFIFCCRLAVPRPPPRFPWSHRQVSPCTASHFLLSGLRLDFPRCGAAPEGGLQGPSLAL